MQRNWSSSVVKVSTVRAVGLALISTLLTTIVAVTATAPAQAIAAQTNSMEANSHSTCAITSAGQVYCWGSNGNGEIGNGESETTRSAIWNYHVDTVTLMQLPSGTKVRAISSGYGANCVFTVVDDVYCAGSMYLDVADTNHAQTGLPTKVLTPNGGKIVAIDSGYTHQCMVLDNGNVYCAGVNYRGQLGRATAICTNNDIANHPEVDASFYCDDGSGVVALPPGESATGISIGNGNLVKHYVESGTVKSVLDQAAATCVTTQVGRVYCWGGNRYGALGTANFTDSFTATPQLVAIPESVTAVRSGEEFNCGLTASGHVYCWGRNQRGQLGIGSIVETSTPSRVALPDTFTATSLQLGWFHACAIDAVSRVYCWGSNDGGSVLPHSFGDPNDPIYPDYVTTPVERLFGLQQDERIVGLGMGGLHTCVMTSSRTLCTGYNNPNYNTFLQNGVGGSFPTFPTPVAIGGFTGPSRVCTEVTSATGQDFLNADFSYCDFTRVPGASFAGDTLTAANLSYANLAALNFDSATMVSANLDSATATSANFDGAILDSATARYATFTGSTFSQTRVAGAQFAGSAVDVNVGEWLGVPAALPLKRSLVNGYLKSANTDLLSIEVRESGTVLTALSPSFSADIYGYSANVPYNTETVTVTAFGQEPAYQSFTIGGVGATHSVPKIVSLVPGTNAIPIVVTAGDGTTKRTTTLTLTRSYRNCSAISAGPGVNLSDCDLRSRNLADLDLSNANLSRSNLGAMNLIHSNLSGANLSGANLAAANLMTSDLGAANLSSANLSSANLMFAAMGFATLRNANLTLANLDTAGMFQVQAGGANFTGANLFQANLSGARMETATLTNANLRAADLTGTRMDTATLSGVRSGGTNVSPTLPTGWAVVANDAGIKYLVGPEANLSSADLVGANLSHFNLTGANLEGADLRGANLEGTIVVNTKFFGAAATVGAGQVLGSGLFDSDDYLRIVNGYFRSGALTGLSVNATMTPAFDVDTRDYYVSLPNAISSIQLTITPADSATVLSVELTPVAGSATSPYSAVETVAVPVGTTTFRVDATVQGGGGGAILTNRWNIHVTRAVATSSGGGGGGGASAPPVVVETSTAAPKTDTATAATPTTPVSSETKTATTDTKTVTSTAPTLEERRLVFTYGPRQMVLTARQLSTALLVTNAKTKSIRVVGYVTRTKSAVSDRARSESRAALVAKQLARSLKSVPIATRGAGSAQLAECAVSKNNCVVVVVTRTK